MTPERREFWHDVVKYYVVRYTRDEGSHTARVSWEEYCDAVPGPGDSGIDRSPEFRGYAEDAKMKKERAQKLLRKIISDGSVQWRHQS